MRRSPREQSVPPALGRCTPAFADPVPLLSLRNTPTPADALAACGDITEPPARASAEDDDIAPWDREWIEPSLPELTVGCPPSASNAGRQVDVPAGDTTGQDTGDNEFADGAIETALPATVEFDRNPSKRLVSCRAVTVPSAADCAILAKQLGEAGLPRGWLFRCVAETSSAPGVSHEKFAIPQGHYLQRVYSPAEAESMLRERLPQLIFYDTGGADGDAEIRAAMKDLSSAERPLVTELYRLVTDEDAGLRPLPVALPPGAAAIDEMKAVYPNFAQLLQVVSNHCHASALTQVPLKLPNILLCGPPGCGKTTVSMTIAEAIGFSREVVAMCAVNGVNPLTGTDPNWRNPSKGLVAKSLINSGSASLILLDEIDKTMQAGSNTTDTVDVLHTLLETVTARECVDEYLGIAFAAERLNWIATANSLTTLPPAILDRFLVLEVAPPTKEQMSDVVCEIFSKAAAAHDRWFDGAPDKAVVNALAAHGPRKCGQILALALTAAISARRRNVKVEDIEWAAAMVGAATEKAGRAIGFIRPRCGA